ncbi:MAG: SGNH/GDSL hydrolase family protein [Lachnospiraceae bacterium]|nr:SGNH/GDSL hydrolase family protein [Lachnospiraceae bacterium]
MRKLGVILCLAAVLSLTACGAKDENQETPEPTVNAEQNAGAAETVAPTEAPKRTTVPARTEYLTEEDMKTASPWQVCDTAALAAVMRKAEAGEPVTIATIGGSITQGTISSGAKDSQVKQKSCYADIFFSWWKETFPQSEITVVNAGIGATDSYLGVHRLQEDVLDYNPDVVLVEYSVNDGGNNTFKITYDNLVYKMATMENAPAVMLLFMGQTNLSSAQNVHQLVGFQYGFPMVSYLNLLSGWFDSGRYTEKDLSGDVTHPSALGHAVVGEILWKYLNQVYTELDSYGEPVKFDKNIFTKAKYLDAELAGVGDITPENMGSFTENGKDFNGWGDVWKTTDGDGNLVFKIKCRNLGILFWRSTGTSYGNYEVLVDGVSVATLQGEFPGGWGNYAQSQEVFTSDEEAEHTVIIKKAANSKGDDFAVLRLMISH